jgi:hypothetical protein
MSSEQGTIKLVYNAKHGGFGLSDKGIKEYNCRTSSNYTLESEGEYIKRSDPVLIELVETMGKEINGPYSHLKIKEFPVKYRECLYFSDYDGKENIYIDYHKYLIQGMRYVKDSTIAAEEKLIRLEELYKEYDERPNAHLDTYIH